MHSFGQIAVTNDTDAKQNILETKKQIETYKLHINYTNYKLTENGINCVQCNLKTIAPLKKKLVQRYIIYYELFC